MDHAADAHRTDLMTITRHVLNEQSKHPESKGDFTILLSHIVLGCKFVCSAVNKVLLSLFPSTIASPIAISTSIPPCLFSQAGLAKLIGLAGETNKKLDVLSNEVFVKALISSGRTVSPYGIWFCVCVAPFLKHVRLIIFSHSVFLCQKRMRKPPLWIHHCVENKDNVSLDDVLQPGKHMVAAGYCMYGSSCTLVLSTGNGVNGFTLDPSLGEFILTHPDIKVVLEVDPPKAQFSELNSLHHSLVLRFVEKCKFPEDGSSPKSLRYIGRYVLLKPLRCV
ncbi:hypothetical protein BHE74_00055054 [Ensete ventricosum]|nr:hypothetical protein BHE74_00055054 [Ensete ventricosum]